MNIQYVNAIMKTYKHSQFSDEILNELHLIDIEYRKSYVCWDGRLSSKNEISHFVL